MNIADVFVKPLITEHSLKQIEKRNSYTFVVNTKASKTDIKNACQQLFDVEVKRVHTIVMKGGVKRIMGKRMMTTNTSNWKKAIIELKSGDSLELFDFGGDKKDDKKKKKEAKPSIAKALLGKKADTPKEKKK